MTKKEFDKLTSRDFQNGAVLHEIRKALMELEEVKKENVFLKTEMQRREDYIEGCFV